MAKQLICEAAEITIPGWHGTEEMPNPPLFRGADGLVHHGNPIQVPFQRVSIRDSKAEYTVGKFRPDVVTVDDYGQLLIEIRFTHAVDKAKTSLARDGEHRMFEIDLSKFKIAEVEDPQRFAQAVLNEPQNRIWLSYPKAETAWRAEYERLVAQVKLFDSQSLRPRSVALNPSADPALSVRSHHKALGAFQTAEPGNRLWHHGLGIGTIVGRALTTTPIYQVDFEEHGLRTVVLEPTGRDGKWRLL